MSPSERAALEEAATAERRVRVWRRCRAVLLLADGAGAEAVSGILGCAASSVSNWAATWRHAGLVGLAGRPHGGGVARLAELAARGWEVRVEDRRDDGVRLQPRYRAGAFRQRPSGEPGRRKPWVPDHHQGSGRTADGALRQVLAAVLAREA